MATTTGRRPRRPSTATGVLIAAAVASSLIAVACGATSAPPSGAAPAATVPGSPVAVVASASASPAPSAVVPTSPPSNPAGASPSTIVAIPDGVWLSDPIPVATVRAMIANANIPAADKDRALTEDFGVSATTKVLSERLELDHGSWVESGSWDGAPMEVGAKGVYASPDTTTIAMQDNVSLITYRVALSGSTFRLTMLSDSGWTAKLVDDVEPAIVFCAVAFHRQG